MRVTTVLPFAGEHNIVFSRGSTSAKRRRRGILAVLPCAWLLLGGTAQAVEVQVLNVKVSTEGVEQTLSGTVAASTAPVSETVGQVNRSAATGTQNVVRQVDVTVRKITTPRAVKPAPPAAAKPAPRSATAPAAPASSAASGHSPVTRHGSPARIAGRADRQQSAGHRGGPATGKFDAATGFVRVDGATAVGGTTPVSHDRAAPDSGHESPAIPSQTDLQLGGVSAGSASVALAAFAVLLALFALVAPALRRTLATRVGRCRPTPFVCVLERPG